MTRDDIKKIIDEEKLIGYNFFENRSNSENEMVIIFDSREWVVYATDERASKVTGSEKKYSNEEEALNNFIKRLRALNILMK